MKKLLSLFLCLALFLSLGIPASAAQPPQGTAGDRGPDLVTQESLAGEDSYFYFQVVYKDPKGNVLGEEAFPKGDVLNFTVAADPGWTNPDASKTISVEKDHKVENNPDNTIKITVPDYTRVGKYSYIITQNEGKTLGVDYDTTTQIRVQVVVTDHAGTLKKIVTFSGTDLEGKKINNLVNTYTLTDSNDTVLSLNKIVAGNMGDKTQDFDVTVTLTKPQDAVIRSTVTAGDQVKAPGDWVGNTLEIPVKIRHDQTLKVLGVPTGVTAAVLESPDHTGTVTSPADKNDPSKGYTAAYEVNGQETDAVTGLSITKNGKQAVKITNTKNLSDQDVAPETGVNLDALPYIILLAVAAAVLLLFLLKRRGRREY